MGLRESGEDGALLRCSESRKVTLGRIAFLSAAFVFSASHPSAADFTRLQERVKLGCGKVEFCLTKLHAPRSDVCHVFAPALGERAQRLRLIRACRPARGQKYANW